MTAVNTNHRDIIHDAQLNYYGTRLATCSSDRLVKVFDVKPSGQSNMLAELAGHAGPVWQLSWAHPKFNSILASAGYDKKVIIWHEDAGRWQKQYEYTGHDASVNSVCFAPAQFGLVLATASADSSVAVLTFNQASGQWDAKKIIKAHDQGVNAVSWAPAPAAQQGGMPVKKRLVTCGNDKLIKIWIEDDCGEWIVEKTLSGHSDFVRDVAWCPVVNNHTHTIASCGQDRSVLLWRCSSVGEGEWQPKLLDKSEGALWHVSWSQCGAILSVSGDDNKIVLWKENLQGQWNRLENDDNN